MWSIKSGKRPTLFESFLFERQIIIIVIKCIFYDISTLFRVFFIFPKKKSYFSKNEKKIQFNNHICSTIHQVTRFSNTKRAIRKLNICLFVCTPICLMIVEREKCLGNWWKFWLKMHYIRWQFSCSSIVLCAISSMLRHRITFHRGEIHIMYSKGNFKPINQFVLFHIEPKPLLTFIHTKEKNTHAMSAFDWVVMTCR